MTLACSENKKLRAEVSHLQEDLLTKTKQTSVMLDGDLKTLQFDLAEKNKVVFHCQSAEELEVVVWL